MRPWWKRSWFTFSVALAFISCVAALITFLIWTTTNVERTF